MEQNAISPPIDPQARISTKIIDIRKMMRYLNIERFNIPSYALPFPQSMNGYYRPSKVWYIHSNGLMSYEGLGYTSDHGIFVPFTNITDITPKSPEYDPYINQSLIFLKTSCGSLLHYQVSMSDIPLLECVMKQFYNLDGVL